MPLVIAPGRRRMQRICKRKCERRTDHKMAVGLFRYFERMRNFADLRDRSEKRCQCWTDFEANKQVELTMVEGR